MTGAQVRLEEQDLKTKENLAEQAEITQTRKDKPIPLSIASAAFESPEAYNHMLKKMKALGVVSSEGGVEYMRAEDVRNMIESSGIPANFAKVTDLNISSFNNRISGIEKLMAEENEKSNPNQKTLEALTKQKNAVAGRLSAEIERKEAGLQELTKAELQAATTRRGQDIEAKRIAADASKKDIDIVRQQESDLSSIQKEISGIDAKLLALEGDEIDFSAFGAEDKTELEGVVSAGDEAKATYQASQKTRRDNLLRQQRNLQKDLGIDEDEITPPPPEVREVDERAVKLTGNVLELSKGGFVRW